MRRKNKFITGAITVFSLFSTNAEAKTANANTNSKSKTDTKKKEKVKITAARNVKIIKPGTKNKTKIKTAETPAHTSKTVHTAKTSNTAKKVVTKQPTVKKVAVSKPAQTQTTHNLTTGIYRISSNNNSPLVKNKMSELHTLHNRMLSNGSAFEKNRATVQRKLLSSYSRWLGTPYAWGGDSKGGIDCSALTRRVYRETFGIELPRTTAEQIQAGKRVSASNLRPGDIVFFKTNGTTNHTAVYVGNTLFINASSSKGVVMSSLESPYWKQHFKYGIRVNGMNT